MDRRDFLKNSSHNRCCFDYTTLGSYGGINSDYQYANGANPDLVAVMGGEPEKPCSAAP